MAPGRNATTKIGPGDDHGVADIVAGVVRLRRQFQCDRAVPPAVPAADVHDNPVARIPADLRGCGEIGGPVQVGRAHRATFTRDLARKWRSPEVQPSNSTSDVAPWAAAADAAASTPTPAHMSRPTRRQPPPTMARRPAGTGRSDSKSGSSAPISFGCIKEKNWRRRNSSQSTPKRRASRSSHTCVSSADHRCRAAVSDTRAEACTQGSAVRREGLSPSRGSFRSTPAAQAFLCLRPLGRPASESGTLGHVDGAQGRGDRLRRSFMLPILSP